MAKFSQLVLLGFVALVPAAPARAYFVFGGFEGGDFTGWDTRGTTSVVDNQGDILVPAGFFQARLSTQLSGVFAANLEAFLGLPSGRLSTLSGSPLGVFNGSAISQAVTVNAGDTLTFMYNFVTNEPDRSPPVNTFFNDVSFVSIVGGSLNQSSVLGSVLSSSLTPTSAPEFDRQGGYQSFSFTFAEAGTYTVGVGVVNAGDINNQSGLFVDSFDITPVPEPSIVTLLSMGFLGVAALRWRRRSHKAR